MSDSIQTARFIFHASPISGLWWFERKPIVDSRGSFSRFYCSAEFEAIGITEQLNQINHSSSVHAGTVRGMHFQHVPFAETKIVSCTTGRIHDVVVDLRPASPTFLQYFGLELSASNKFGLIIPPGFAHGFQSLDADSEVLYLVTAAYSASHEDGLNPFDPAVGISWPLPPTEVSERDARRLFIEPGAVADAAASRARASS